MSYREKLETCKASGQMSAAEVEAHAVRRWVIGIVQSGAVAAPTVGDAMIDKAIYDIDAVMNGGVEQGVEVPPFMAERMVEMRAIIRKLIAHGAVL